MPIKTQYSIYDSQHKAPMLQTFDKTTAYVEWQNCLRQGGEIFRLQQNPIADGELTKSEQYLMLVYRVRKLTIHYRNNGQKPEDRNALMEHIRKLDKENRRSREFLNDHKAFESVKLEAKSPSFMFFVLVEAWRSAYYERQKYSKVQSYDHNVYREMTRKIRQFEKEIDEYIKQKLKLI